MPKDTKTLGNNKARACESLGFVHKKGCARVLTQPLLRIYTYIQNKMEKKCHSIYLEMKKNCIFALSFTSLDRIWIKFFPLLPCI